MTIELVSRKPALSLTGRKALHLLAVSVALPFFDLPWLEVSISAPLFAVVALEVVTSGIASRGRYWAWLGAAFLFAAAQTLSVAAGVLLGHHPHLSGESLLLLVRYVYWAAVFAVIATVVHNDRLGEPLARTLSIAGVALALIRIVEGVVHGSWGGGNPVWLSQNDYGLLFSMLTPFVVWRFLNTPWPDSTITGAGVLAFLAALLGNGSRSSWISAATGCLVLVLFSARRREGPRAMATLSALGLIAIAIFVVSPNEWRHPIVERAQTLWDVSGDKPYLTRQVLVAKGLDLFRQHPIGGVGAGSFHHEWVDLDLPTELRYQPQAFYNRRTPHNSYIKLLAEGGLVGFVPFLVVWTQIAYGGLRRVLAARSLNSGWTLAALASFCATSLHLWNVSGLTGTGPWFIFGLTAAAALGRPRPLPTSLPMVAATPPRPRAAL